MFKRDINGCLLSVADLPDYVGLWSIGSSISEEDKKVFGDQGFMYFSVPRVTLTPRYAVNGELVIVENLLRQADFYVCIITGVALMYFDHEFVKSLSREEFNMDPMGVEI